MDFKFTLPSPEIINEIASINQREKSILDFQLRVFDLISLDTTPIMEKINFIKIISSNLEEFITTRLVDIHKDYEMKHMIRTIELIYRKLGDAIIEMNEVFGIKKIESDCDFYKKLNHVSFKPIYSEENDYQTSSELIDYVQDNPSSLSSIFILYSGGEIPHDSRIIYAIKVPKEIIQLDEYIEKYKQMYGNEVFSKKNDFHPIKNYRQYLAYNDLLIRNPYESYQYVTDFIHEMCIKPEIRSIFITLYRTAKESKIVKSLIEARKLGKSVHVYVELTARGDEYNNLKTVKILRENGIYVKTNYFNYKVHSKLFLAIDNKFKKYAHIGTGNYNENTAKMYTDFHLITADDKITNEVSRILVSLFEKQIYHKDIQTDFVYSAPINFRSTINSLIRRETEKGNEGKIWIKCNNLCDMNVINLLYKAADSGVDVKIICRTGCSISPRKNLEVKSKVGQYLEHDRFYIFGEEAFISSADLLFRNISKRLEILCKINSDRIPETFKEIWNSPSIHKLESDGLWKLEE